MRPMFACRYQTSGHLLGMLCSGPGYTGDGPSRYELEGPSLRFAITPSR